MMRKHFFCALMVISSMHALSEPYYEIAFSRTVRIMKSIFGSCERRNRTIVTPFTEFSDEDYHYHMGLIRLLNEPFAQQLEECRKVLEEPCLKLCGNRIKEGVFFKKSSNGNFFPIVVIHSIRCWPLLQRSYIEEISVAPSFAELYRSLTISQTQNHSVMHSAPSITSTLSEDL